MSNPQHAEDEDFGPSTTPGYKLGAAKSLDEYANLDAQDESLNRWKASLGIVPGAAVGPADGPKVTLLTLELLSPTLPAGRSLKMDLQDPKAAAESKNHPFVIKEGTDYNVRITFRVNHSIVTGLKYQQVVKRAGVALDKMELMIGSYQPQAEPHKKDFPQEESPSGMLARSGTYHARSRVVDDDGAEYAKWDWYFKIGKEW